MSNLLKKNAYHVLGLDTSANQRDVQKRAKEIIKMLQIDDMPEYDLDLGVFEGFRTEDEIKESIQKLTSPKKQIKDYFFWFNISDEIDEQALGIIQKKDPAGAIHVWEHHSLDDSTKSMFHKKNLAILYCVLLFKENNQQYLTASLKIWKELIESEKFWSAFIKIYKLNDELNTSQEIISDFRKNSSSYLSDLYTELSHAHKDDKYISEFTKFFNVRGEKTEKVVLNPIFHDINIAVEKLEAMKVSEDGEMDKEEAAEIKQHITTIQECCNKLIDLGLYDDSQAKTIRDRAAAAIRSIVIDIHNNLDDIPKAEQLLKIAMQFVGTSGMKHKIQQDIDQFETNKKVADRLEPILNLLNDKKYEEALALIEEDKNKNEDDPEFIEVLDGKKKEAVTLYATYKYIDAKILYDANKYDEAIPGLEKAASIVYENIEIFDVNKDVIDKWLETIKSNIKALTSENASEVDDAHNNMLNKIQDSFEERWELFAMKVLINSYFYIGIAQVVKSRKTNGWLSRIGGWIVGIIVIAIIRGIIGLFTGN